MGVGCVNERTPPPSSRLPHLNGWTAEGRECSLGFLGRVLSPGSPRRYSAARKSRGARYVAADWTWGADDTVMRCWAMRWERPEIVEIKMGAESSGYQEDAFEPARPFDKVPVEADEPKGARRGAEER